MKNTPSTLSKVTLMDFVIDALCANDFSRDYASVIAPAIVEAHLRGTHNQGLGRLPQYIKRIQAGLINKNPEVKIENQTSSIAVMDADNAMGHYAGTKGMELAVEMAKESGIGAVAIKNSNHFGVAGYYSQIAARNNQIGIVFTNSTALISAPGGAERIIGNNPLSIAVPSSDPEYPTVLDMACSNAAFSSIQQAVQSEKEIPLGWGTDENGVDTTDPKKVLGGGMLLPSGGYKGYGMAVMFDVLAGVLTGSAYADKVTHLYQNMTEQQRTGHFMIAIDIEKFIGVNIFSERMKDFSDSIRGSRRAPGVEELFLPGDKEVLIKKKCLAEGVSVPEKILGMLKELAEDLGIKSLT